MFVARLIFRPSFEKNHFYVEKWGVEPELAGLFFSEISRAFPKSLGHSKISRAFSKSPGPISPRDFSKAREILVKAREILVKAREI